MITIRVVRDTDGFKALQSVWDDLLSRSKANTVFLTWEWLFTWWTTYSRGKELRIIVATGDGRVVGIAPFYLVTRSPSPLGPRRVLRFLGTEGIYSDYLSVIVVDGHEHEVHRAVFEYLFESARGWDVLSLSDMPADSSTFLYCQELVQNGAAPVWIRPWTVCPYIPLPREWEAFVASLGKNTRREIRRERRNLGDQGRVEFVVASNEHLLDQTMQSVIKMHQARWNKDGEPGHFSDSRYTTFHEQIVRILAERGWLLLSFLRVNDEVVAVRYQMLYGGKAFDYQCSYDLRWGAYSVGFVLFSYCVEHAIAVSAREVDCLQGDEPWKDRWAKARRVNMQVDIWRPGVKGRTSMALAINAARLKAMLAERLPLPAVAWLRRRRRQWRGLEISR